MWSGVLFFVKQKTAYEMRISDWSSDVCSSDLPLFASRLAAARIRATTLEHYELQALSAIAAGGSPGLAASVMKIVGTELSQHLTELALDAAGEIGRASCRERVCQYV